MSDSAPEPDVPSAPQRRPVAQRLLRWLKSESRRIVRSDHVLITVIAISMTLSAFSVFQATRASDEGEDLADQARIVQTQVLRQAGYLRTLIDHDVDVLRPACQAALERDRARDSYFDQEPRVADLVPAQLTLEALQPLLLGDRMASCAAAGGSSEPHYVVERARQRLESFQRSRAPGAALPSQADAERLAVQAADSSARERWLMSAGLLFALVVAGVIAIDQLGARRVRPRRLSARAARASQYGILAGCVPLAAWAIILLLVHGVDVAATWAVVVVLIAAVVVQVLWLRWVRGRARRPANGGRWRWWAELVGAAALVAFTAAALGFSFASIQERDSKARGDRQDALAQTLQQIGQQQALRDLEGLSRIASLDAEEVTFRQLAASSTGPDPVTGVPDEFLDSLYEADAEAMAAMREELDDQLHGTDQDLRDQLWGEMRAQAVTKGVPLCDVPPDAGARTSGELFAELELNPDVVMGHVLAQQQPALSCDVRAALSRYEGRFWSDNASLLTVVLVVLGLAGFLLALAASSERSARSSRTLLILGAVGTTGGLILGLWPASALASAAWPPGTAPAGRFGADVAAAIADPCAAEERMDAAIRQVGAYGPAFQARAFSGGCTDAAGTQSEGSAERRPGDVADIIADLGNALRFGPETPMLRGELGWFQILEGLASDDDALIRDGVSNTEEAIERLGVESSGSEGAIHILRFRRAFGLLALGDSSLALEAYREAGRCVRDAPGCPNGGLADPDLEDGVRLGALADLELMGHDGSLDEYRFAVLDLDQAAGSEVSSHSARLVVLPQQLEVQTSSGAADSPAAVVWYHRPDDESTWSLLPTPSAATREAGDVLNTPTAARAVLPRGQFRADVYTGGRRIELRTQHDGEDETVRRASRRLGISVVVPSQWREWRDDGVEWHVGPDESTGVTVRRVEGAGPVQLEPYLHEQLETWPATAGDGELTPRPDSRFLGLSDVVAVGGQDGRVLAAAGLAPYASHWGCGGALFMARVTSDGSAAPQFLYDSMVLEREADRLAPNTGALRAGGVSLRIPWHWDGAPRPEGSTGPLISGKDCTGDANVIASSQPLDGGAEDYVDERLALYEIGLPEFELEGRESIPLDGATEAVAIQVTWQPPHLTRPVRQWRIFASDGDTLRMVTVSINAHDTEYYSEDVALILRSVALYDE